MGVGRCTGPVIFSDMAMETELINADELRARVGELRRFL